MMNEKEPDEYGDARQSSHAYRDGVRRAYSRLVWAYVDKRRGKMTRSAFADSVLRMTPSEFTRGLDEGKLTLEKLIVLVVHLDSQISDLPNLPQRSLLAAFGYNRIVTGDHCTNQIQEICMALAVVHHADTLAVLKRRLLEAPERAAGGTTSTLDRRIASLEIDISNKISGLFDSLRNYQDQLPDDIRVPVSREPLQIRESLAAFERWGTELYRAIRSVDQHKWMDWS